MDNKNLLRLNKYISESGICSRREADKFIESGKVYVNGILATLGTRVSPTDTVVVDGKTIKPKSNKVYIALNKPVGITCTTETHVKGNIIDFVNYHERIFPIGRLDKPSEGLIFLTNDGDMVNKILRAGNNHEKEYVVSVDKPITKEFINAMENGIPILGTMTKQCKVRKIGKCTFNIILTQGLNRQIRRMCEYLGFKVTSLKRIRIMNVSLSNLPTGKWRYLSSEEMSTIINLTKDSIGTI
ncbi:MAG TPA: 23S rRNA pseudouridine(2604) synthase RluF [Clostridium sp.]|nr:23S rRNA pseudouridine(2604) synthase RluF [Clostridium sp.]HBA04596.1 23S rRNA pseudouridine(2604) synthase RluF [Clostridium sp.]